jgi:hypothetical protein
LVSAVEVETAIRPLDQHERAWLEGGGQRLGVVPELLDQERQLTVVAPAR